MITVFLPCRAGSVRVPKKNTKFFAEPNRSLLSNKIDQLVETKLINYIVVSTNDQEVVKIAKQKKSTKIIFDDRPDYLASSSTSTDDLVGYVTEIINEGHILWTHVTSPFVTSEMYTEMIEVYLTSVKEGVNDSLMTVTPLNTFLCNSKGEPVNYDRSKEKWPRTQTIDPLFEINSAAFIAHRNVYLKYNDRIGESPFLFKMDKIDSFDVDWKEDFEIAELMFKIKR